MAAALRWVAVVTCVAIGAFVMLASADPVPDEVLVGRHSQTPHAVSIASFAISSRTLWLAQRASSSFVMCFLSDASLRKQAGAFGLALGGRSAPVGAHQKGEQVLKAHAFSFAHTRPVTQPVIRLNFRGASLESRDAAARVPAARAHGGAGRRAA